MSNWVLRVEVNGEWEECGFTNRTEALATLVALARDYSETLKQAMLIISDTDGHSKTAESFEALHDRWVN